MALHMRMATQWRTLAMRGGKKSSEGPKTKAEKRVKLGGNAHARHVYVHPHAAERFPHEYARLCVSATKLVYN